MPFNIFAMPASSIILLFSIVFTGSNALPWTEAQQTHVYEADPWSPRPTFVPRTDPARLFSRDSLDIAICGWLGGNSASAATCSPGSSCVRDTVHGVVGCCATAGPCTAGVYTSCIDMNSNGWTPNSGLQDNGIYTCSGTAVCYKNTFPGGYYQYGCGESSWATTVETTYSGQPTNMLLQQVFTGIVFTPTSGSTSTTSSTSSSSSSSSTTSSSSSSSTTLPSAGKAPTQTATTTPTQSATTTSKKNNTGAIIGGVIGGLAFLALIGAALFFFLRKRNGKDCRAGPFESAHSSGQAPTSGPFQRIAPYQPYGPNDFGHNTDISGGAAGFPTPYSYSDAPGANTPPHNSSTNIHHQFYVPHEEEPLVSEIDHFSQSYHRAIGATVPRGDMERDTHIHTGDLPDTVTGLGMGVGVSPLGRTPTSSNSRSQDRDLNSESLRSPVGPTVPRLGESQTSLVTVPPRSPLREGLSGMGASLGSAVSAVVGRDNAPRYQLVDEARDDVPILSSPGQLRGARMSRNVSFEDKGT